ncbi:MAG: acetoin utilization protein AcuC [Magnetococcales bacterium]|nr:acetoin utilization protein AcuC [Magnetococcales bacterium]
MTAPVCVTIGDEIARYGFGNDHPFGPHRMGAFWERATRTGLALRLTVREPVMAERTLIERFHTPVYVEQVLRQSESGTGLLDMGDTPAFKGVYEAAGHVVGSAVDLTHAIMKGSCRRAFIPIAGLHHARRDTASGFCVFNDCGVVIETLKEEYGLTRIAYVDIDAHHGDGVFYGFESDPAVIFADMHQDGHTLYPGTGHPHETGTGSAEGLKLNLPMPPGSTDSDFFRHWPMVEAFIRKQKPEFILLQCGTDSIAGDPITQMAWTTAAHAHAAKQLALLAEELGHGRILATGGGGYNPVNIAEGWCAVVESLLDTDTAL